MWRCRAYCGGRLWRWRRPFRDQPARVAGRACDIEPGAVTISRTRHPRTGDRRQSQSWRGRWWWRRWRRRLSRRSKATDEVSETLATGTRDGMNAKTHKTIGLFGGAAALIVALGWGVNAGGHAADVRAEPDAPISSSPAPPPPPPPPMTVSPDQDYWTGQGSAGGAPGAGGGAGGAGGAGGGG
jgi:hypothetical protein